MFLPQSHLQINYNYYLTQINVMKYFCKIFIQLLLKDIVNNSG